MAVVSVIHRRDKFDHGRAIKKSPKFGYSLGASSRCLVLRLVWLGGRMSGERERPPRWPNARL